MNTSHHLPKDKSISAAQARAIDRVAGNDFGVAGIVLMENAARGVADFIDRLAANQVDTASIAILCGKGNNGGDGWALARHLALRGYTAQIVTIVDPNELAGDARTNAEIIQKLGMPIIDQPAPEQLDRLLGEATLVVDALLGTGITGRPRPPVDEWIERVNQSGLPVLAVDIPSGLDADNGAGECVVRSQWTCTFVRPKHGLMMGVGPSHCGQIQTLDIGIPDEIIAQATKK